MFARLGALIARHWHVVILAWVILLVGVRAVAPRWEDVTQDGDFAFLPENMPSVVGERLLTEAFSFDRAKSQVAVVVARDNGKLREDDLFVADDLVRRFLNMEGATHLERARELRAEAEKVLEQGGADGAEQLRKQAEQRLRQAAEALDEAIHWDQSLTDFWLAQISQGAEVQRPRRLAEAFYNRSLVHQELGETEDAADLREQALTLMPELADWGNRPAPEGAASLPIVDVWSWHETLFGEKLVSHDDQARLIVVQLSNEFMATDNIRVNKIVNEQISQVRGLAKDLVPPGLTLGISGSAAVGGDMLQAAAESIRHTEWATALLIIIILAAVYRSPLMVAVPMVTIGISLFVATSVVALLTQLNQVPGFGWWELKIFTTTKIFIVVILFGAGTDFCLFLIARYREHLALGEPKEQAIQSALVGVGDALVASAFTTILGLGTMYFADFGKFRYSGPVIGLCLAITLLACLTLTPAVLRALGSSVFWPFGQPRPAANGETATGDRFNRFWNWMARAIVARPGLILVTSVLVMLPLAGYALRVPPFSPAGEEFQGTRITYDVLAGLSSDRPSKQGAQLMRQHFEIGESGPLTVLAVLPRGTSLYSAEKPGELSVDAWRHIEQLAIQLQADGVRTVRSAADPLGEYPSGKLPRGFGKQATRLRVLRAHPRVQNLFLAHTPDLAGRVARFDLILKHDPFSSDARLVLNELDRKLIKIAENPDSPWHGATFAYSGITAGIRDLRAVTQSDESRIKVLVVLAVLGVLLVILRRPMTCLYMIISVLFSYYVTIGATELLFTWLYGAEYQGLDWKVPLFLFVILVAIGEDYNVYLATRVFEEQAKLGPFTGLRRAIVCTGGIITSCGVIMAGTFISMTSGAWGQAIAAWSPELARWLGMTGGPVRAILELGVALSLGVMLDTFVVRPVLVPAFLALVARWSHSPLALAAPAAATASSPHANNSFSGAASSKSGPAGTTRHAEPR